jgi:D-inositol-3-phosphate glycosyltransferase
LELELPHVITFHTLALIKMQARVGEVESHLRSKVEKDLMRTADQVVAFSPHERDAMVMLYDANAERIKLIPCGVDLSLFRPMDRRMARKKLGLNGHKVLVWVGRVEPLKGLDLLMHTTAQMTDYLEMKVLVVGGDIKSDREIGRLRRLALDLKVDKVFKFVGRVTQQNLPMYYNAADVCVIPSYYESFGLAALEAMACGTPVVATRVGGLSTVIQHGRTGYLKSWRCPEAFANSLEILMLNKSLQRSMGLAARHRAEGMGWDKVAAKITNIYNALATGVTPEMLDHTS